MEDKTMQYLIQNALLISRCQDATDDLVKWVNKQIKSNKRQRCINIVLGGLVVACVCNIGTLIRMINAQNTKIEELDTAINGNEEKGE